MILGNNEGFVKLHRSFLDWEWYGNLTVKSLFIHLLLKVNHEEKQWQGTTIRRGQTVTSLPKLAQETGLSVQQIRSALEKLKATGEITEKTTNKNRVITLNCYGKYQSITYKPTDKQQTNNIQTTDKQHSNNIQITPNKNEKNVKNEKNDKNERESTRTHGKFGNVFLTDEEYNRLQETYPDYRAKIDRLSQYMREQGKRYDDHYAVICRWAEEDGVRAAAIQTEADNARTYDINAFDELTFLNEMGFEE
jgi:biotin operon repressor